MYMHIIIKRKTLRSRQQNKVEENQQLAPTRTHNMPLVETSSSIFECPIEILILGNSTIIIVVAGVGMVLFDKKESGERNVESATAAGIGSVD